MRGVRIKFCCYKCGSRNLSRTGQIKNREGWFTPPGMVRDHMEYRCQNCKHTGWSRHRQLLDFPQE